MSISNHNDLADAKGKIGIGFQGLADDFGRKSVFVRAPLNRLVCGEGTKPILVGNDLLDDRAVSVDVNLPSNLPGSFGKHDLFDEEWAVHGQCMGMNSDEMHCLQGCSSNACGGNSCRQRQETAGISSLDVRNR